MSDLISRQAAIDALQEKVFHDLSDEFYGAMQVLDELPSAVVPVIHAHWNEFSDYTGTCYAECSRCGLLWWIEEGTAEENEMFYCPKCGARMDGGENDG